MTELDWNSFFNDLVCILIYCFQLHVPFSVPVMEFQVKINLLWKLDYCSGYS